MLVFEGGSGRGKSIVVRSLMPVDGIHAYCIRVDDFTPAAFVSHAANRTLKDLEKIDLLPKISNKTMLTKELAPLFRDDEKELRRNFATLTSVLDGDGYKTNSGTQGSRGYEGRYVFNWIGATTPIPERTHRIMAQLGNRILFCEVAGEECSEDELMDFGRNYGANDAVRKCQKVVSEFLGGYFGDCPPESVDPETIVISADRLREIVRYAKLITVGRVEMSTDEEGTIEIGTSEGAHRPILLLQTLARGLALIERRQYVTADDLTAVRHIAFSSLPQHRRESLRALLAAGGYIESSAFETALATSRPTALGRMEQLAATGICSYTPGDSKKSLPAKLELNEAWKWLLPSPL